MFIISEQTLCGRRSKIVTATVITSSNEADGPQLGNLLEITSRNFRMLQVAADGAYYSGANMLKVAREGGVPYFLIPDRSLPRDGCLPSACNLVLYLYARDRVNFFKNYYKRNNVETAFSMIRACLGTSLRSTSRVAQYNEAICKVVCHNLRVLNRAMHEEDVSPNFEPVASYISRVKEATRTLAETIANGRLTVLRKKPDSAAERVELFATKGVLRQSDTQPQQGCGKEQVEDVGKMSDTKVIKPHRKSPRRTRRHIDQLTLFEF